MPVPIGGLIETRHPPKRGTPTGGYSCFVCHNCQPFGAARGRTAHGWVFFRQAVPRNSGCHWGSASAFVAFGQRVKRCRRGWIRAGSKHLHVFSVPVDERRLSLFPAAVSFHNSKTLLLYFRSANAQPRNVHSSCFAGAAILRKTLVLPLAQIKPMPHGFCVSNRASGHLKHRLRA